MKYLWRVRDRLGETRQSVAEHRFQFVLVGRRLPVATKRKSGREAWTKTGRNGG